MEHRRPCEFIAKADVSSQVLVWYMVSTILGFLRRNVQSACGTCSLGFLNGSYGGAADIGKFDEGLKSWLLDN